MPTLFSRRYVRPIESVSRTERVIGIIILLLVAAVVVIFIVQASTNREYLFNVETPDTSGGPSAPTPPAATNPFPDPGLPSWRAPARAEHFVPDDLYVKIDGRAEVYLKHHVAELVFGTYTHESQADRAVDVYWYNMGAAEDARQVYEVEAPPGAITIPLGEAGYQVGGAVFFRQGPSYVQLLPAHPDDEDARAALAIAGSIAQRIAARPVGRP